MPPCTLILMQQTFRCLAISSWHATANFSFFFSLFLCPLAHWRLPVVVTEEDFSSAEQSFNGTQGTYLGKKRSCLLVLCVRQPLLCSVQCSCTRSYSLAHKHIVSVISSFTHGVIVAATVIHVRVDDVSQALANRFLIGNLSFRFFLFHCHYMHMLYLWAQHHQVLGIFWISICIFMYDIHVHIMCNDHYWLVSLVKAYQPQRTTENVVFFLQPQRSTINPDENCAKQNRRCCVNRRAPQQNCNTL